MSTGTISDTLIHIGEPLSPEARSTLADLMREIDGVVSPGFNPGKEHLLVVAYNTDKTSASVLLEKVRRAGYTAQLVGM